VKGSFSPRRASRGAGSSWPCSGCRRRCSSWSRWLLPIRGSGSSWSRRGSGGAGCGRRL